MRTRLLAVLLVLLLAFVFIVLLVLLVLLVVLILSSSIYSNVVYSLDFPEVSCSSAPYMPLASMSGGARAHKHRDSPVLPRVQVV